MEYLHRIYAAINLAKRLLAGTNNTNLELHFGRLQCSYSGGQVMTDKITVFLNKYAAITKAHLKEVVTQYAAHFPDWEIFVDGTAFVRH